MREPPQRLRQFFARQPVLSMDALVKRSHGRSRRSLFRDLAEVGYLSSFTHAGGYYTLPHIPRFDHEGLWFHQGVGFSRTGTLKATVVELVDMAETGRTHQELRDRVRVRMHNTLLDLVCSKQIEREPVSGEYVYLSADPACASRQLARRHELVAEAAIRSWEAPPSLVIEVLSEVLQSARLKVNAEEITSRLRARGVGVTLVEVERILESYGVEKKGARQRSRRSKR